MIAKTRKRLSPSLEDYLEAVLDLIRSGKAARVRDIARRLEVGMPSVSLALRALAQRGLVNYDPYELVTLTEQGQRVGREIDRRHQVLQRFFADVLGLDQPAARANACRVEHAIDLPALERLQRLLEFLQDRPRVGLLCSQAAGGARSTPPAASTRDGRDAAPRNRRGS